MSSRGGADFPKQARLRKRPEFLNLSRWGKKIHVPHFVIITRPNDRGEARLGITVSAKVGNAVGRNRVKRLLRECFRRHRHQIVPSHDVLIIARKGAVNLSWRDVERELREILVIGSKDRRT
jgi:ribonuclease P protein component